MNLEEYRALFLAGSLALILIASTPALGLIIFIPSGMERFSELWLLGPTNMVEGYPLDVGIGEEHSVFVGVSNHVGCSVYYNVSVKFRNQTQPLPDISNSKPSPLPPLYEFRFFVEDDATWESLLTFDISDALVQDNLVFVGNISINGVTFPVNNFSMWDSEYNGFYFQLFFELWMYDDNYSSFRYHNRFVGIWLNMTF